jgi:hypothetical protein
MRTKAVDSQRRVVSWGPERLDQDASRVAAAVDERVQDGVGAVVRVEQRHDELQHAGPFVTLSRRAASLNRCSSRTIHAVCAASWPSRANSPA